MQWRTRVACAASFLFLIYCVSLQWYPNAKEGVSSWSHKWPDAWFNGVPSRTDTGEPSSSVDVLQDPTGVDSSRVEAPSDHLDHTVFKFQEDLTYPQPSLDLSTLAHLRPHNLKSTGQHPTYATFFSSRSFSLQDPYFIATLQLIYRTLWSPTLASTTHPLTVFVGSYIPEQQRAIFRGAGANVIELPVVEWQPIKQTWDRWKDLFSKIHMWNQTQFSRIVFLDSDAIALQKIDDIFELCPPQTCVPDKLEPEDAAHESEICEYVFAGAEIFASKEVNCGVLVLAPNTAMHARLVRNMVHIDQFDSSAVEQGYLNWQFNATGPFPVGYIPRMYNGYYPQEDERMKLKIVHEKLWFNDPWGDKIFESTHREMVQWFDNPAFLESRTKDGSYEDGSV